MKKLTRIGNHIGRQVVSAILAIILVAYPLRSFAHPSEQGFVLLLPTDFYIATGIATVALTAAALARLPTTTITFLFSNRTFVGLRHHSWMPTLSSFCSTLVLVVLILIGLSGSGDPLSNPLSLVIWTVWWTALLFLQGILGDLWKWINPWTGIYDLCIGSNANTPLKLPDRLGNSVGLCGLILFFAFTLADPAPDYPPRLALVTALYWMATFIGMCLFGRDPWLSRCECFTMLFRLFALISGIRTTKGTCHVGFPGWQIVTSRKSSFSVFALTALAAGSFDGMNETFWWLSQIGVNPLEFPGRSAVIGQTIGGMIGAIILLHCLFALCIATGQYLVRKHTGGPLPISFSLAFGRLALSVLPIALGYHFAHYLPAFLVNSQYLVAATNDPLTRGADLFGLGVFYVTTGFFYTQDTVRVILLTQCVAIVIGHMIAVLTAHLIALGLYGTNRQAILSQIPMAVFMILYTLLSLWLLAAPRGA
ncbi:MAG: hypothetical protein OXE84_10680 [Rhodobacteraceae bacterium]|nr:hypothetical protein [Paracoccaceae bacterium]MCY4195570.1 hypothetical protein [Paracoccaceae bacterium]